MLIKYNTVTGERTEIILPPVEANREVHEFYVDAFTGDCYLIKISDTNLNTVFLMKEEDYSFHEVVSTKDIVRGVYDRKFYVSGVFDGAIAHYLIPVQGQNPPVKFIEND